MDQVAEFVAAGERIIENMRIREFRDYVKKHAPFLVKHIYAMPIGEHDGRKHNPVHAKLRALAKAFREGKKPPKIKKPYRPRKAKAVDYAEKQERNQLVSIRR